MDFDTLYLRVLKYLNYRPRSEKEIRDYIQKTLKRHPGKFDRTHSESDSGQVYDTREGARMTSDPNGLIDLIIHKLKQQKFLNDYDFARMWVRSRTQFKPKGERVVRLELFQKGVSKEIIDEVLSSSHSEGEANSGMVRDELSLAVELLEKKKKKYVGMDKQERFNKAGSMLARRGFDLDVIRSAMDKVFGK